MKKRKLRILAVCLALGILLSGCGLEDKIQQAKEELQQGGLHDALEGLMGGSGREDVVPFSQMAYSRPDMQKLETVLQESCRVAETERDIDTVLEAVYAYYDVYDRFFTDLALADIYYSADLRDTGWEAEYNFCMENSSAVDAGLEELYRALARSPIRDELESDQYFGEDYFASYEGESVWDEALVSLLEQEAQLENRYYTLTAEAAEAEYYSEAFFTQYGQPMAELFVELVALRQQIAQEVGYDSYPEFAYDFYHYRDYTPQQAEGYLEEVRVQLLDIYERINQSSVWELSYSYCEEQETFDYVKTAARNMGGNAAEAFRCMEEGGLYDITYGQNKMEGAFEVFLWSYYEPYVFLSPYLDQTDKLTFAHEFGHFVNDYVSFGSYAGTDVAEVHSQGFEYMSLLYGENTEELTSYKLADSLCIYMEQAAYALFEQQVYALEGEALTVEAVYDLYEQIGRAFGFDSWDWDSRDFVLINHFYTDPMYIISYVVSNDVAFQMYQLELEEPGAGLAVYDRCLESQESYLVYFAEQYGLEDPFAPGRLEQVRATLEKGLSDYL